MSVGSAVLELGEVSGKQKGGRMVWHGRDPEVLARKGGGKAGAQMKPLSLKHGLERD